MIENRYTEVLLVSTPIMNLTINSLVKSWKKVMEYGERLVNYVKVEL